MRLYTTIIGVSENSATVEVLGVIGLDTFIQDGPKRLQQSDMRVNNRHMNDTIQYTEFELE